MAKRKHPKKGQSPGRPPQLDLFSDRPPSFALILTDRGPILKEWRDRYRSLERELAELSKKTEDYHFQAVPAYQAWVARTFGEELSAIRELEEKIRESEIIAMATLEEARVNDEPPSEAYQTVLLRKERGEDLFPSENPMKEDDDWNEGWKEVDPTRDYREEPKEEEPRAKAKRVDPDEASREYFREKKREAETEDAVDAGARLKSLYRKLAFALHPDSNPNQGSRERKIWDEVQIAYADRDLERMEMLYAWIESGSENWLEQLTHVGTLRTLVLKKLAEVRTNYLAFNRLKKAAPWKFWVAREAEEKILSVRDHIEKEFIHEFMQLRRRLREFEIQFHRWETGVQAPRSSRRKKRKGPTR